MSGASSRRRGHDWEVLLANELSEVTGLHVVTTRSLGANYGADLATVTGYDARERPVTHDPAVLGWSCEAKAVKRRDPAGWLRQADEQRAPNTIPVVLWKRPNKGWREGSAFVIDDAAPRGWWEMSIATWVDGLGLDGMVRAAEEAGLYEPDVQEACDKLVADRLASGTWYTHGGLS